MRALYDQARPEQRASALMIMLPGALQDPQAFRRKGFVDALRRDRPDVDVALVDPGIDVLADALNGKAMRAIHEAVVEPARAHYSRIWMAGISIGGFLALSHAAYYPDIVNGLCLLAPYPGTRLKGEEAASFSLLPDSHPSGGEDMESLVRHWLRTRPRTSPRLWLGYGRQDRFADGLQQMAKWIPHDCIEIVDGGHDWAVWHSLWDRFLCNNLSRLMEKA
jgi:pimeloyl-ACP methyl ester carboxylesterase